MNIITLPARYYQIYPPEHEGHKLLDVEVSLERAALLVVDIYGLGFTKAEAEAVHLSPRHNTDTSSPNNIVAMNRIRPAMQAARTVGLPVIYTHNSGPRIDLNKSQLGKVLNRVECNNLEYLFRERNVDPREYYYGEEDLYLEYSEVLKPQQGDYFIRKHFPNSFKDTRLDTLLRNLDIRTLFCVGFDGSWCLLTTMLAAFDLNYEVILLRDATNSVELRADEGNRLSFTERMILYVEMVLGVSVTTEQFIEALAGVCPEAGRMLPLPEVPKP